MKAFIAIKAGNLSPEETVVELRKLVPDMLAVNNAPDFIHEDGGHYFGTDLPDSDKRALIEFLRRFRSATQPKLKNMPTPATN
jgi:hypothetical protein